MRQLSTSAPRLRNQPPLFQACQLVASYWISSRQLIATQWLSSSCSGQKRTRYVEH